MTGKNILSNGDLLMTREHLDSILDAAPEASDIFIKEDSWLVAKVNGVNKILRQRKLIQTEMRSLMSAAYESANGYDAVKSTPESKNFAYISGSKKERFRVVIVKDAQSSDGTVSATFRRIAAEPWSLEKANPPEEMVQIARLAKSGIIIVGGPTGSGKSALLSSILSDLVSDPNRNHRLATVEQPVEFVYGKVAAANVPVDQLEVGKSVKSFADGVHNHLRMAPTIILIGEIRDPETADAAIWAAQSGHLVFATMHPSNVSSLFSYWSRFFPAAQQREKIFALASHILFATCQHLVRTKDGGRIPVREWLDFTCVDSDFPEILSDSAEKAPILIRDLLKDHGISLKQSAEKLFERGIISNETAHPFIYFQK